MKKFLFILLIGLASTLNASLLEVYGTFRGENLIVINPFNKQLKEFCITSVNLNGKKVALDLKRLTLEIDFKYLLTKGDAIHLKVYHKAKCKPTFVNLNVIKRKTVFVFTSINVSKDNYVWSTRGEQKGSEFIVQRYQNGDWEQVLERDGYGGMSGNNYNLKTTHYSGVNKYRVKYTQLDGFVEYSNVASFRSVQKPIAFFPTKVKTEIVFVNNNKRPVKYKIYDIEGHKITEGEGLKIDCTSLEAKKVYTLVFDNQKRSFQKLKVRR